MLLAKYEILTQRKKDGDKSVGLQWITARLTHPPSLRYRPVQVQSLNIKNEVIRPSSSSQTTFVIKSNDSRN